LTEVLVRPAPARAALFAASALLAMLASIALPSALDAQTKHHVIQGRVTTDSGAVVTGADVIVTIAPTAETITGKSDSSGLYRVAITDPTGEYLLYVGSIGRKPFRQRVTITALDSTATINVRLLPAVTQVAGVRVQARKARPSASLGGDRGLGTDLSDKTFDGVTGALSPDQQGDLSAMASFVPGLALTPAGVSAFGLGADNNSTTLNGLAFGAGDLPRDAQTTTRFRTSPWDPTAGGFNGVQTAVQLGPGGNITRRRGHVTLDAPGLQFSDRVSSRLGQKYTNLALDEGGTGAFRLDKYFYNFGVHAVRQTAPVSTLADLDPAALATAGISVDSAEHLVQLLGSMGIPLTTSGIPRQRTTTSASYVERFDLAPAPTPPNGVPGSTRALTLYGRYSRSEAQTLTPTAVPGFSGATTTAMGGVQGLYAKFFGKDGDYVNELTSSLSLNGNRGTPYVELPSGSVLIASDIGLGSLAFGGNSALQSDSRGWTWETINQTDFLAKGKESLPMKIYLQSRLDGYTQSLAANRLGRFGFNSLADVAAGRPASFSRTLNAPDRSGGEWIGAAAVGGNWTASRSFSMTGGVRVDANAFTAAPRRNPEIEQLFDARTDHAPSSVSLSPRVGFNWRYSPKSMGMSVMTNGAATEMRGATSIRGGIGKFRGILPPTLLADATANTGLPGGMQQLLCIGSAVPAADWRAFAADASAVPSSCAGGASNFADTARGVTLFARGYDAPESWRGSLGWTNTNLLNTYLAIDGTYSLNLHQPGTIDLNFAGTPRFTLGGEANRPVFVNPESIVPTTGSVSAVEARSSSAFGRVNDRVSDLRGDARQLAVYAIPNIRFNWGIAIFGYTYSDARIRQRGFDASTSGDPRAAEWAPSPFTPRHQFTVQYSRFWFGGALAVAAGLRTSSGLTFTPLVAGDINGDGLSNDRAFIFDPNRAPDANVANGLRDLMATGSKAARDCLSQQAGGIAARNSCVGPWFTTMNANLGLYKVPRTDNRVRAFLNFANLPGALDELLHGDNHLHGWGALPLPDATLYQVRGFDQTARAFIYQVNPRFGASGPATTTRRNPFRITLDVQLDLGRSVQEQQVEQNIRVRPSMYGTRATTDTIKARYLRTQFSDIYAVLLRNADSLALSRNQAEALQAEQKVLKARADSIFSILAQYLAALPENFDVKEAAKHVKDSGDDVWKVIYAERDFLQRTLTPGQIALLPGPIREMVVTPGFKGRFFFGF
jgi:hypothetical protein